jgi:hypothetical protein
MRRIGARIHHDKMLSPVCEINDFDIPSASAEVFDVQG